MVYEEYFQFPLFLSILFLFLAIGLREVKWAAAVLILITGQHALAANSLQEYHHTEKGIQAFEEKDYAASIDHFSKSQASDPQSMTHHMNLGDAFLKSGAPDRAIPEFEKVLESTDLNEAARGAYNLGKSFDGLKNHDKALGAYQKGLEILSKAPTFDHEIAFKIKRAMEESQNQKQGQSSQQDQKSDSGKGGEQDQKPKDEDQKKDEKEDEGDKKDKQKDKEKQYKNPKREFKAEKLSESDAKRILKQLQEQEKQTQQRVMRMKNSGKRKEEQPSKDW